MFSYVVQQVLANPKNFDPRALILTDRIELLTQAGGTLGKFGLRFEPITADNKKVNHRSRCYVGMVETYHNRLKKLIESTNDPEVIRSSYLVNFNQVILDEAHKGAFSKIHKLWDSIGFKPFVIGATATPLAASKNDPLSNYYDALANRVQIADLVEQGYLSPCITYSAKIDRSKLKKDNTGEYSDQSQMDTFATRQVYTGLLQRYQEVCDRYNEGRPMRTIIFNVNVAHSLEVTQMFSDAGIPCQHVDGMTPKAERESILLGYKSGTFPVICNVGILNAGFDDAETCCIIMNRATTSVSLWLQSIGRGSRIAPSKQRFICLDMGDNWTELGLWNAERDWDTLWKEKKRKSDKEGVPLIKTCEPCGAIVPMSARVCPECGEAFLAETKALAEASEFVEITADMLPQPKYSPERVAELKQLNKPGIIPTLPVETLLQIQEVKEYKMGWLLHKITDRAQSQEQFYEEIAELARLKGYKRGWIMRQEYKPASAQLT